MEVGEKVICIYYIYMEEDVGKFIYEIDGLYFQIDFNWAGVFLLEIVLEFDLCFVEEVDVYMIVMCQLVCYLGVLDGNMEQGFLCCDVNVLVCLNGQQVFGECCEIKNFNFMCYVCCVI